jgi:hypothetical protein
MSGRQNLCHSNSTRISGPRTLSTYAVVSLERAPIGTEVYWNAKKNQKINNQIVLIALALYILTFTQSIALQKNTIICNIMLVRSNNVVFVMFCAAIVEKHEFRLHSVAGRRRLVIKLTERLFLIQLFNGLIPIAFMT